MTGLTAFGSAMAVVTQDETLHTPDDLLKRIQVRVFRREESISKSLQDSIPSRKREPIRSRSTVHSSESS